MDARGEAPAGQGSVVSTGGLPLQHVGVSVAVVVVILILAVSEVRRVVGPKIFDARRKLGPGAYRAGTHTSPAGTGARHSHRQALIFCTAPFVLYIELSTVAGD